VSRAIDNRQGSRAIIEVWKVRNCILFRKNCFVWRKIAIFPAFP
jgi:hypothetical protein